MGTYVTKYYDGRTIDIITKRNIYQLHKFATPYFPFSENEALVVEVSELNKDKNIGGFFFKWENEETTFYHIVIDNYLKEESRLGRRRRKMVLMDEFLHFIDYYLDNRPAKYQDTEINDPYIISKIKINIKKAMLGLLNDRVESLEPLSELKIRLLMITMLANV